jgi:hypothetical protein
MAGFAVRQRRLFCGSKWNRSVRTYPPIGGERMSRRGWIIAGMLLTTPCLLFTCILGVHFLHCVLSAPDDWWVENRTAATVWVTPVGVGDRGPARLPYYTTPLSDFSAAPFGEVRIEAGERRSFAIDTYVAMDIGGPPGLVVRTAADEHWYCKGTRDGESLTYLLDGQALLNRASDEMVTAVHRPTRPVNFGIPFWVIIVLGLAAPIILLKLRTIYRKLQPTQ